LEASSKALTARVHTIIRRTIEQYYVNHAVQQVRRIGSGFGDAGERPTLTGTRPGVSARPPADHRSDHCG
jgi:hypothetical protein